MTGVNDNLNLYISGLVERARKAQVVADNFTQRQVDEVAAAIVYKFSREDVAAHIADFALKEAGMGLYESKVAKMTQKMPAIFYDIKDYKTVGVIERYPEKGLIKLAKAMGVIASVVPSTNPEATPIFNGVLGLRGRNAVIFAPHPRTKKTTKLVVDIMRDILKKNDMPEDLFICIEEPSKQATAELMSQCDMTMATGSHDMVKAAYRCGKPAIGVGTGNAPVVVDETADLKDAAEKICIGKIGDNASGCSAENELVVQESIYDELMKELKAVGGYMATPEEKEKIKNTLWIDGQLNRAFVTQPIDVIAKMAGIEVPDGTKFIMVEEVGTGPEYPFSGEKLSLILTVYKFKEFDDAINLVNKIHDYMGKGHSCGIHSTNQERIELYGEKTKTSRVTVRQPNGQGNSGAWYNGLHPTFSLGCGTWGGNSVSENVTQKHFINTTLISFPIDRKPASDNEIYGDLLDNINF